MEPKGSQRVIDWAASGWRRRRVLSPKLRLPACPAYFLLYFQVFGFP